MPTYWGDYGKGSIKDPAAARPAHRGAAAGFVCGSIGRNAAGESVKGPGSRSHAAAPRLLEALRSACPPRGRALPQEARSGGPGSDQRAPERPGQDGGLPTLPRFRSRADPAGCAQSGARSQTQALNHHQGNRLDVPGGGPGDSPLGLCVAVSVGCWSLCLCRREGAGF